MTKYIILTLFLILYLMVSPAHAATGEYSSCAGNCWSYPVEYYTASEIKEMKPKYFCDVYVEIPRNNDMILVHGYALQNICEKNYHMAAGSYNFINPELK